MPISSGSAGGLPGLNLKAWAYITGAGVLIRGFNVSSASRAAVGQYTVNFDVPMLTKHYVIRVTYGEAGVSLVGAVVSAALVGSASMRVRTIAGASDTDVPALWEFYE